MPYPEPQSSMASDVIISLPKLRPFLHLHKIHCSKCGESPIPRYVNYVSAMIGRGTLSTTSIKYCEGGLPPSAEDTSVLAQITGNTETRYTCGGYNYEHLHVICKGCGHHSLMEVDPRGK